MEAIKNEAQNPSSEELKDLPEKVFIVMVKNQKNQTGYMGQDKTGKTIILNRICPEVLKFGDVQEAKKLANSIKGVQTDILGKHRIEKILLKQQQEDAQDTAIVVPMNEIKTEMYRVCVKSAKEIIGYITYKPDTDEYSMTAREEGSAFWDSEEKVDAFIEKAKTAIMGSNPGLLLEKVKIK